MGHSFGFNRPEGSRLIESINATSVAEAHFFFALVSNYCNSFTSERYLHDSPEDRRHDS